MRSSRLTTALVVAAFASVLTAGSALAGVPAPPPKQTGSIEMPSISDSSGATAATCHYSDSLVPKLDRITVAAPSVYWPDQVSEKVERGNISWRIVVQKSTDGGTTWSKYRASLAQTALATENSPASLTKRKVSISIGGAAPILRVFMKLRWVKLDGTTKGTYTYWYSYARYAGQQPGGAIAPTPCPNKLVN